jgi:hypothetical protein
MGVNSDIEVGRRKKKRVMSNEGGELLLFLQSDRRNHVTKQIVLRPDFVLMQSVAAMLSFFYANLK